MEVRLLPPEPLQGFAGPQPGGGATKRGSSAHVLCVWHPDGVPRSFPRSVFLLGLTLAVLLAAKAEPSSAASPGERVRGRLDDLRLELAQVQVMAQMGTSAWLALQAPVKKAQARMQHDRRELRRGAAPATARTLRADLRDQKRHLEPLMPSWLAIKALLHRSYDHVKRVLREVRRELVAEVGPVPGRNGAGAWLRVVGRTMRPNAAGRIDACPVDGPHFVVDTFGAPRPGGRFHEGIDLQTARGIPIAAALPGYARRVPNTLGGNAVIVDSAGGTYTYYAHLSAYGASGPISAGDVIGYAGASGDARGLIPHLHFELHPGGGDAVDAFADLQAVC
jgi:murein DD-endopeptidase MepM/ murein hydrolase activator NlpD